MEESGWRAVVLDAGIGGLLAARVLSEFLGVLASRRSPT
jgi:hypothetical protein